MKTFTISRHFDGNITMDIEANTEEQAEVLFDLEVNAMTDMEFLEAMGIQDGGTEIWEDEEDHTDDRQRIDRYLAE